jgi:ATP-dependent DNA ligase
MVPACGSLPATETTSQAGSPFIAMAIGKLPVRSCLIDGEAIVCDENGLAIFDLIRRNGASASAVLCAFDLLELEGRDLRHRPIEERKGLLAKLLNGQQTSIVINQVYEGDGATVFHLACQLGCEGIVSKRLGSIYRRGPLTALGKGQKSESASGHTRSGGGLGAVNCCIAAGFPPFPGTGGVLDLANAH